MDVQTSLSVVGLTKSFGAAPALDGVSFDVAPGTIHALLGSNGSGKSTTIKILSGMYRADGGTIAVGQDRHDASSWSAAKSKYAGLRFVHQQASTFPELTVAENLAIGHGFESRGGRISWRAQRRRAVALLDRFGLDIDPGASLARYGVAKHAMVAIARALQDLELDDTGRSAGILVLDEPTAALPPTEVDLLLTELVRLASEGQTIVYVTHRLEEVTEIAGRATVLRDGRVADTLHAAAINHDALVAAITGAEPSSGGGRRRAVQRESRVRVRCESLAGGAVRRASLEVGAGEILGVAGLLGSGRSTLLQLIAGHVAREAGSVILDDNPVNFSGPRASARTGVVLVPEDRRASAAFMDLSVRENMGIPTPKQFRRSGRLAHRAEAIEARQLVARYGIRTSSIEAPIGALSGGNQQKALLARWLRARPRVLLLDEPTTGVDIGARAEIWRLVREAADDGASVIAVLSDFAELVEVCDRVVVLSHGRTTSAINCAGLTDTALERAVLEVKGVTA